MKQLLKYLISGIIILLATLLIVASLPIPGNYKLLTVLSGSMEPAVKTGSVAIVKPVENYQEGDIITFGQKDTTTHRIHKIETDGKIVTKGDANQSPDVNPISKRDIQGRVLFALPLLGYLVQFLKTPQGFVFLIIIPGALLIYEELHSLKTSLKDYLSTKKTPNSPPTTALILLFLLGSSLGQIHQTRAYFSDRESSLGNSLTAGQAYATLYDSNPFSCPQGATKLDDPEGLVSFIFTKEEVTFEIKIMDGTPNSSYDIWFNQDPGACPLSSPTFPAGMATNTEGEAQTTFTRPRQDTAAHFWISAVGGGQVLRSTALEEEE